MPGRRHGGGVVPDRPWLFVGIFPIWFFTVVTITPPARRRWRPPSQRTWRKRRPDNAIEVLLRWMPMRVRVVTGTVIALVMVNFALFGSGQPERIGGRYYDDDHGSLTELTWDAYDGELRAAARAFTGHAVLFMTVAGAFLEADGRRRAAGSTVAASGPGGPATGAPPFDGVTGR